MKYSGFVLVLTLALGQVQAQDVELSKSDYIIYSVKKGKTVKPKNIVNDMADYDVLFFGEEHNDSIGHRLQTLLLRMMYVTYGGKTTLSMEMFDRDVQYIMDEYLLGRIKEYYFKKDSRKWKNYNDYQPMVEFAKENGLDVVCANAPFRYVNVAGKGGIEALEKLSDRAKEAMAPLPYNMASGKYADKLKALMSHDSGSTDTTKADSVAVKPPDSGSTDTTKADSTAAKAPKKPAYNMIPGQSLWDATMAYSVYQYFKEHPDAKVIHLNGKFHTDEYFGIIQRLAEYAPGIKPLVISLIGSDENYPKVNFDDYKHLGDYIIFTNPSVAKSY